MRGFVHVGVTKVRFSDLHHARLALSTTTIINPVDPVGTLEDLLQPIEEGSYAGGVEDYRWGLMQD